MKKIVFLHPAHYEQAMGGAELQISLLIDYLNVRFPGVEIHVIFEDNTTKILNTQGVHLVPLKKVKISKRFGNRWFLHRKQIVRHLESIRPDVIYTRFFSSWSGIAAEYAKQNSCMHIWALASDQDVVRLQDRVPLSKPLDRIENKWVAKAFQLAGVIVTQNNHQQEILRSVYGKEGLLIRQSTTTCPENQIVKPNSTLNVCWIANLKPIKQPDIFLELAKRFSENSSITFTMIGRPDDYYTKLVADASRSLPNFQYLRELSNDEVNERLCESHILVNTSLYEGFSNTFVQAWMRKVVVMSLNSDPDHLLTTENLGFLLNSPDEMEQKLNELIHNKELLSEMGQKAFDYANEYHSYTRNMEVLTKIMKINE